MIKTYKYRLYGNKFLYRKLDDWLELCRVIYNTCLQQRVMIYKQDKSNISMFEQSKQLTDLKKSFVEFNNISSQTLQEVVIRLNNTYKALFSRLRKNKAKVFMPRYKTSNRYNSFTLKKCGWKLDGKHLTINKVGKFKLRLSRNIIGNISIINIKRMRSGKWYACIVCDCPKSNNIVKTGKSVGLDVGISSFLTDSEGNKVNNHHFLLNNMKILRKKQRNLSRKVFGSKNYNSSRILLAKEYERIANKRRDFLHKLSTYYVENYDYIYIEKLTIMWMLQNKHISRSISDVGWYEFFKMLFYKAEGADKKVIKVERKGTSQICSSCGNSVKKEWRDRIHNCPYCGLVMDRDENAARNILRFGENLQPLTCASTQCVG